MLKGRQTKIICTIGANKKPIDLKMHPTWLAIRRTALVQNNLLNQEIVLNIDPHVRT
jgi:hypothetical protein